MKLFSAFLFRPRTQIGHSLLAALLMLMACGTDDANAANPTRPHPHQGLITPYNGAPPEVVLSASESSSVASGTPVYKQIEVSGGGRAVAVFKVKAPAKTIWSVISDFDKYPQWIDSLTKAKVYKREGDKIFTEFTLSAGFFGSWTYYVEHNYPMEKKGWGTWKLDYSRESDLDDSVGFWHVKPVPGSSNECIVTYSVEIKISSWIPDFVKNMIVDGGLKEATQWVKVQSEQRV